MIVSLGNLGSYSMKWEQRIAKVWIGTLLTKTRLKSLNIFLNILQLFLEKPH